MFPVGGAIITVLKTSNFSWDETNRTFALCDPVIKEESENQEAGC